MPRKGILVGFALLAVGAGAWLMVRQLTGPEHALQGLRSRFVRGLGSVRPVEGRLSWQMDYGPFGVDSSATSSDGLSVDRFEAKVGLTRLDRDNPSAATKGAMAVVALFDGDASSAVTRLESAVELAPDDAVLLSDLAAAYLARARIFDTPYDVVLALESADRAVTLDPNSAAAHFNLALALERFHLRDAASRAWEEALEVGQGPGWEVEAQNRSEQLSSRPLPMSWDDARPRLLEAIHQEDDTSTRELVTQSPSRAKNLVIELLGSWADGAVNGDGEAASSALHAARIIGQVLSQEANDDLARNLVSAVERVEPDALPSLARGHRALRDGVRASGQGDVKTAKARLAVALVELNQTDSAARLQATYELARFDFRVDGERLLAILTPLAAELQGRPYPLLRARTAWLLGMEMLGRGRPAEALARYRLALQAFHQANDERGQAAVEALVAEAYRYLGSRKASWRHNSRALSRLDLFSDDPRRTHTALETSALTLLAYGHTGVARHVQDQLVRLADSWGHPEAVVNARTWRSRTWRRLGRVDRAREDLEVALSWLERIDEPDRRELLRADLVAERGQLLAESSPGDALSDLTQALTFYSERDWLYRATAVYGERARVLLAMGRLDQAREDLEAGIRAVESQRVRLAEGLKTSWLDHSHDLFEALVELEANAGNTERAFHVAERARALALLDARSKAQAVTVASVQTWLQPDTVLVEYFALPDRLLVWVIQRETSEFFELAVPRLQLSRLVDEFEQAVLRRDDSYRPAAVQIHDAILREPLRGLAAEARLLLVPGDILARVPFATLIDRESGRHLVEHHPLVIAPGASLLIEAPNGERSRPGAKGVVVLGNPAFSAELFPDFPDLPAAEVEARRVASLYPEAELWTGASATKSRLLGAAGNARVVHFAGHSIANQETPELSRLALAEGSADNGGALYGHEIAAEDWRGTELVVLSSCSGAAGPGSPTAGALSLGRSFLLGGASAVLASLWPIDDQMTVDLFQTFHQRLSVGDSPNQALRAAQITLLRSGRGLSRHPFAWAGFAVVRGVGQRENDQTIGESHGNRTYPQNDRTSGLGLR